MASVFPKGGFVGSMQVKTMCDDETSDEEDIKELRCKAKASSKEIAARGYVSRGALVVRKRSTRREPMDVLQEALTLLQEVTSHQHPLKSDSTNTQERSSPSAAKARRAAQNAGEFWSVADEERPMSGALAHFVCTMGDSPFVADQLMSLATQPTERPPSSHRSKEKQKNSAHRLASPITFRMDRDAEFGELLEGASATGARGASITRCYDALTVLHCSLDDGSDDSDETRGDASQRESSIHRCYDALGTDALHAHVQKAARLPPLRPPRSGGSASDASLESRQQGRRSQVVCKRDGKSCPAPASAVRTERHEAFPCKTDVLDLVRGKPVPLRKHSSGFLSKVSAVSLRGHSNTVKSVLPEISKLTTGQPNYNMRTGTVGACSWNVSQAETSFGDFFHQQLVF